jgi:hypothetical protein
MMPNVDSNEWNEKCLNDVGKEILKRVYGPTYEGGS